MPITKDQLITIRKKRLRLTQTELGYLFGVHRNTIWSWENDDKADIPDWVPFALAWLAVFGPHDPFADDWRPAHHSES